MRVLGVDFGESRTGVAVSDPMGWTAQGLEAVSGGMNETVKRIARLARQYEAKTIIVGYPLNMNGTAGFRAERTDMFISALTNKIGAENAEIVKWDERLSSAEAARVLKQTGARPTSRREREKGRLDIVSAAIMLQSYMDSGANINMRGAD
jgi:putative Holliday junction resolvase